MLPLLEAAAQKRVEKRVLASLKAFVSKKIENHDTLKRCVTRAIQLGRADLAAEIVEAGSDDSSRRPEPVLERILGETQLTGVAFFERGQRAARAVGRIVIGSGGGFGTGFMVSPRLMLTNNHVLRSAQSAAGSVIEFDFARDLSGNLLQRKVFRLQPNTFFRTNSAIDYSLVAVEPVNSQQIAVRSRGWLHLIRQSGKAVVGERLNIIQHPDAKPQMIALRENTLVGVEGFFLHYSTDTRPGSSGSPVMNDQFQLAALHHAGVPKRDGSGRILKKNGQPYRSGDNTADIRWVANEGARVSQIVLNLSSSNLSSFERQLFDEAFVAPPLEGTGSSEPPHPNDPNSLNNNGPAPLGPGDVGSDGLARWNFQLTFGPTPAANQAVAASVVEVPDVSPASLDDGSGSVHIADSDFGSSEDNDYYDEDADAAAAADYYEDVDPDAGSDKLYTALKKLVTKTHKKTFSYRAARHDHLYPVVDRHPDGGLRSVYSDAVVSDEVINREIAQFEKVAQEMAAKEGLEATELSEEKLEQIDFVLEASGPFNCEHVVPQSWFKKAQPMKADLHHLFTCEPNCNSFRSNIPYWEFNDDETEALQAIEVALEGIVDLAEEGARPGCGIREGRKFEPETNKGAVARATMYFLLRYPGKVGDVKSGPKLELTKSRLEILLTWSEDEPPTAWEKHRNAEIAKSQGNRNPLIDHPEWAREINFDLGFG